ncbi:MAG: helix-turn-helix transcriptional regulator [Thermostichus sp. HHBFW_bins_43]
MAKQPLDELLLERMQTVGITSWRALQIQAGVSRRVIDHLRRGEWGSLRLHQLRMAALALQWDLGSLLKLEEGAGSPAAPDEAMFSLLQPLLTGYPTIRQIAQRKPDWPAQNVTALFRSLDALLQHWGCEPIGSPLESVLFEPQLHQPDQPDIQPGDPVFIRFVGYRRGGHIFCPAKVSRSLPGGLS